MRISERSHEKVTILDLLKPLAGDFSAELFVPQIESMLDEGKRVFVLSLEQLEWVHSTEIGLLVGARRKIEDHGGRVVLAGLNDRIKGIMKVVGLLTIWDVFDTSEDAVAALEGEAKGTA